MENKNIEYTTLEQLIEGRRLLFEGAFRVTYTYVGGVILLLPDVEYIHNGKSHRVDGPSYIDTHNDIIKFNIDAVTHKCTGEYCRAAGMGDEDTFMWLLRFGDTLPTTCEGFYGQNWKSMRIEEF